MKKTIKRMIVFCLAIVMVFSTAAVIYAESIYYYYGFLYTYINNDLVSLYGVEESKTQVHMPDTLNGRKLVDVSNRACMNNTGITLLEFSNAIYLERIGNSAFLGCTGISGELKLPSSLTLIEDAAFRGCSSIEALTLDTLVEKIPDYCFDGCSSLSSVTFNENVHEIGYRAFTDCPALKEVTIPKTVTSIDDNAFDLNSDLTINCYYNSAAMQYAEKNGVKYIVLDPPAPTEPPTEPVTEAPTEPITPTQVPTQEPTAEPTQQPTEAAGYYLGDVDNNGVVDVFDVTFIQRHLSHIKVPAYVDISHGEIEQRGIITAFDATLIMRYLDHFNVRYPIGVWVNP